MTNMTRETRIYLAIWRKAWKEKDLGLPPVVVKASSRSTLLSMVTAMYRAIKPYRDSKPGFEDSELSRAAEGFIISAPKPAPGQPHVFTMKERKTLLDLEAELAELGISEEDLMTAEERIQRDSLAEFLQPETKPALRAKNLFFERD